MSRNERFCSDSTKYLFIGNATFDLDNSPDVCMSSFISIVYIARHNSISAAAYFGNANGYSALHIHSSHIDTGAPATCANTDESKLQLTLFACMFLFAFLICLRIACKCIMHFPKHLQLLRCKMCVSADPPPSCLYLYAELYNEGRN